MSQSDIKVPMRSIDVIHSGPTNFKDELFVTGRINYRHPSSLNEDSSFSKTVQFETMGAQPVANNDSVIDKYELTESGIVTRSENVVGNQFLQASIGSYLTVVGQGIVPLVPLVIRDHPKICPGYLINPSGMLDGHPSFGVAEETNEESPIVYHYGGGECVVPVLVDPWFQKSSPYYRVDYDKIMDDKRKRKDIIVEQIKKNYDIAEPRVRFEFQEVKIPQRDKMFLRRIEFTYEGYAVDIIPEAHVYYQGDRKEKLNIISSHVPYEVELPEGAELLVVDSDIFPDGKPFGRDCVVIPLKEFFEMTKKELVDQEYGERTFGFADDYMRLVAKYNPDMFRL